MTRPGTRTDPQRPIGDTYVPRRGGGRNARLPDGLVRRPHGIVATDRTHNAFANLTPIERGRAVLRGMTDPPRQPAMIAQAAAVAHGPRPRRDGHPRHRNRKPRIEVTITDPDMVAWLQPIIDAGDQGDVVRLALWVLMGDTYEERKRRLGVAVEVM